MQQLSMVLKSKKMALGFTLMVNIFCHRGKTTVKMALCVIMLRIVTHNANDL